MLTSEELVRHVNDAVTASAMNDNLACALVLASMSETDAEANLWQACRGFATIGASVLQNSGAACNCGKGLWHFKERPGMAPHHLWALRFLMTWANGEHDSAYALYRTVADQPTQHDDCPGGEDCTLSDLLGLSVATLLRLVGTLIRRSELLSRPDPCGPASHAADDAIDAFRYAIDRLTAGDDLGRGPAC